MAPGTEDRIYWAGECAVCAGAGAAVFLRSLADGRIFFACAACGCAWANPPESHVVDTVDPTEKFAPSGFAYATIADIRAAGLQEVINGEGPVETWDFSDTAGFAPRES